VILDWDLLLDSLLVIHPGPHPYPLGEKTRAIPIDSLSNPQSFLLE